MKLNRLCCVNIGQAISSLTLHLTKIHPCNPYSPYLPGTGKNVPMAWVGSPAQPQMIIFRILVTSTYVTEKEERRLNQPIDCQRSLLGQLMCYVTQSSHSIAW